MKLGRGEKKLDPHALRMASYFGGNVKLPPAPPALLWAWMRDRSHRFLERETTEGDDLLAFGTFLNLELPSCTCSALGHLDQVVSEQAGTTPTVDDALVKRAYYAVASNPPESGAAMIDALRYFRDAKTLAGYVELDPGNKLHVQLAVLLTGACYVGANLPLAAKELKPWQVALPNDPRYAVGSWGGHTMIVVGYDHRGVWFVTWGRLQFATWSWFFSYVDEAYAPFHTNWKLPTGLSPGGELAAAIAADMRAMALGSGARP